MAMSLRSKGALSATASQPGEAAAATMPKVRWESVFATSLDKAGTYTKLLVYSDMNARWTTAATPC
jgi:hypothetical protein